MKNLKENIKTILSLIIFSVISFLALQVIENSKTNQVYKNDSAELNHFVYGMLNVDVWKEQISTIISDEIDKLYMTRRNEKTLKSHLEVQLGILIDKIYKRIESKNSNFKNAVMDQFIDIKDIKSGIPEYADAMLAEMSSSKTESQIKSIMKEKITHYLKETFSKTPDTAKKRILMKYGYGDEEVTKIKLQVMIESTQKVVTEHALIIIALAILMFLLEGMNKDPLSATQYILLTLTLVVMLIVGVMTPMIDMEAKITKLSFVLFDHPIEFKNQILYFQSKSILDVFSIMIHHKQIQMKLVGILMICFSIVFPVLKMISSLAYFFNYSRARTSKIVKFFVEKSGKWSMADVMIVAVFMAYIGFNGVINTQMDKIRQTAEGVEVMTTNGTSLQPGFFLFFAYTVLAMFLAGYLKSITSSGGCGPHPSTAPTRQ